MPDGHQQRRVWLSHIAVALSGNPTPGRAESGAGPSEPAIVRRPSCRPLEARASLGFQLGELDGERVDDLVEVTDRAVVAVAQHLGRGPRLLKTFVEAVQRR